MEAAVRDDLDRTRGRHTTEGPEREPIRLRAGSADPAGELLRSRTSAASPAGQGQAS
jgi:hypothetical protein